ncbi:MAG: helix-turn-helix transcriptional regulator [Actinomycetales bacterium]|nr:helix-turn-helix transcriptional regulator [Actinomycetales bacterium]
MPDEPGGERADPAGGCAEDGAVVISDPRTIRALAHPARITVLHHLYAGEVLTATEFAQLSGLTASAMSYHLRALERWGLITRAEPAGDGRERPWRSLGTSIRVEADASVAARAAEGLLLGNLVDLLRKDLTTALAWSAPMAPMTRDDPDRSDDDAPPPTNPAPPMGFTVVPVTLTGDEAEQLMTELHALLEGRAGREPDRGARRYHVFWAALPLTPEPGPEDPEGTDPEG